MGLFDILKKKKPLPEKQIGNENDDEEFEEYVVASFTPKKFTLTSDLIRRERETDIRKKYCLPNVKTSLML